MARVLLHLFFGFEEYRTVFCVIVGIVVVVHVVQRLGCEWTSSKTAVLAWRAPLSGCTSLIYGRMSSDSFLVGVT
jgi:hypothetical protein